MANADQYFSRTANFLHRCVPLSGEIEVSQYAGLRFSCYKICVSQDGELNKSQPLSFSRPQRVTAQASVSCHFTSIFSFDFTFLAHEAPTAGPRHSLKGHGYVM